MKKNSFFLPNFQSFFIYITKNKKPTGDQIPPKESSICGKKRTEISYWYNVA